MQEPYKNGKCPPYNRPTGKSRLRFFLIPRAVCEFCEFFIPFDNPGCTHNNESGSCPQYKWFCEKPYKTTKDA